VYRIDSETEYGYDSLGRLVSVLQPAVFDPISSTTKQPETQYGYDAYGNMVSITDANGRVTTFSFDQFGRQTGRTLPDDGNPNTNESESTVYGPFGEVDYTIDFNGAKVDSVYDYEAGSGLATKFGRLARLDLYDPAETKVETVEYRYDELGRIDTVTETKVLEVRVTDTDFCGCGQISKVTTPEGWIAYKYDQPTGRRIKMWTANTEVQYGYDILGRLTTVSETKRDGEVLSDPLATSYAYDEVGNVSKITVTEGTTLRRETTNSFDSERHWLVGVTNKDGGGTTLSTFNYTRRADGQITDLSESVKQPDGSTVTTTAEYTYDALNRLTKEEVDVSTVGQDYTKEYTLELVGNRTKLVESKEGQPPVTTTNTYNARDQLLTATTGAVTITYSYDSNGSLIMQVGGGDTSTFDWDLRGRMIGATVSRSGTTTVAEYRYTPAGIRSSVTETVNGGQPTTTLHIIDTLGPSGYAQVVEEGRGAVVLGAESEPGADPL
jgi:YD repeat-containing protein